LFLSLASVWEIAIKVRLKKLTLAAPFITFMTRAITRLRAVSSGGDIRRLCGLRAASVPRQTTP
jgi:PIN domain nuclease of toxin-antitoxin system